MKHFSQYLCGLMALMMLLTPNHLFARSEEHGEGNYNFGYVSLGGGYTSLCRELNNSTIHGSVALLGGLGYEFRRKGFWLSVGAQYQIKRSSLIADEYYKEYAGLDDLGKNVTLVYRINQKDQHNWTSIDVPLMAGYYYKGFYVGAGAKVGISFGASATAQGTYELMGKYINQEGIYPKEFTVRDFGYYKTYDFENKVACKMLPEIAVIGEIGYDLLSRVGSHSTICHLLKIGFYWECGVNNIRPSSSLEPITIPDYKDATVAVFNPMSLSTKTDGQSISNFVVGVKLTYVIGGSRSIAGTWHVGCQCYGD